MTQPLTSRYDASTKVQVVDAEHRAVSDLREVWAYRDTLRFLIWRDIKARYAQSVLGVGWAVLQPLFSMVVFTVVFGRLAKIESDGQPYAIFSFVALVPWTYFSTAISEGTGSLVKARGVLQKVYFPRLIIPVSAVLGKLVDFLIASVVLAGLLIVYRADLQSTALLVPLLTVVMVATALGATLWLTPLAVQYRDVSLIMPFAVQLLMYLSPIVYPLSLVPERFKYLYALNPMVGVIEGCRAGLLGSRAVPWAEIGIGCLASGILLGSGYLFFRRMDRYFADVA